MDRNGTSTKIPLKRLPKRNRSDWPTAVVGLVAAVLLFVWCVILPVVGLMYLVGVMK